MKILLFEYITGGGFNKQALPETLKHEGYLMLQALLHNFASIAEVNLTVMLDQRMLNAIDIGKSDIIPVDATQDVYQIFTSLVAQCDAVWPIAPEFNGILQTLCAAVEVANKVLLTSSSHIVALAGNKLLTYQYLQQYAIAAVPTQLASTTLADLPATIFLANEWMIKVIDGVGCLDSWLSFDLRELETLSDKERYIIQPHLYGQKTSLSCLFKKGQAWLICANIQHFELTDQRYHLCAITVNYQPDVERYRSLVNRIAQALPDLWGYAGIDLIETPEQIWVLEINPRLTTAFVGIEAALGINVGQNVLQLLSDSPTIKPLFNKPVTIKNNKESHAH